MTSEFGAPDELALIEDVKAGRRASFDVVVNLYRQKGFGIAYNLVGNVEDTRDVLQEAFIKMYLYVKGFQGKSRFSTWFYRIVINCAFDFLRQRKRGRKVFAAAESGNEDNTALFQIPDARFEPRRAAHLKELANELDERIGELSKMQKACFVLKHQNSLGIQEISEILKCNPATVKVHLFRAVGNLRKSLAQYLKTEGRP
jgi:RNA polymerase sigma-70 factor (ECF subfamily)